MGTIFRNIIIVIIWLSLTVVLGGVKSVYADEADIFLSNLQPNVLIILDNSNKMDEDFLGNAICSWATGSRSVEGRRQLLGLVNANANNMRIGLMSFRLPAAAKTISIIPPISLRTRISPTVRLLPRNQGASITARIILGIRQAGIRAMRPARSATLTSMQTTR